LRINPTRAVRDRLTIATKSSAAKRAVAECQLAKGGLRPDAASLHDGHCRQGRNNRKSDRRNGEQQMRTAKRPPDGGRRISDRSSRGGQCFVDLEARVANISQSTVRVFLQTTSQQVANP
jgi:hypothetical protein